MDKDYIDTCLREHRSGEEGADAMCGRCAACPPGNMCPVGLMMYHGPDGERGIDKIRNSSYFYDDIYDWARKEPYDVVRYHLYEACLDPLLVALIQVEEDSCKNS
jgi:hypothetical protein